MKKYMRGIFCNAKRRFIFFLFLCGLGITINGVMSVQSGEVQSYIRTAPKIIREKNDIQYDPNTGVYTIMMKEHQNLKILQLTDVHIGGSRFSGEKDLKAYKAIYDLVNYSKPDLIIVTGDVAFPLSIMADDFGNTTTIIQFATFMNKLSIPWAFTPGNHDVEVLGNLSEKKCASLFNSFSYLNKGYMLYSSVQPDITGIMNQIIEIRNSDRTLNQLLFLIDSNSYIKTDKDKYDFIHDDQVQWYEEEVQSHCKTENKLISSMMFFHIPLEEYKQAYDLYVKNSPEVKYYFGQMKERGRKVCCSDCKSKLFEKAVELGSTKAMFAGHDHYNNISMEYKGIRLTYGMSIDYLAMLGISKRTQQRGGTLVTLHQDSSFDIQQIKLTDIQNKTS